MMSWDDCSTIQDKRLRLYVRIIRKVCPRLINVSEHQLCLCFTGMTVLLEGSLTGDLWITRTGWHESLKLGMLLNGRFLQKRSGPHFAKFNIWCNNHSVCKLTPWSDPGAAWHPYQIVFSGSCWKPVKHKCRSWCRDVPAAAAAVWVVAGGDGNKPAVTRPHLAPGKMRMIGQIMPQQQGKPLLLFACYICFLYH